MNNLISITKQSRLKMEWCIVIIALFLTLSPTPAQSEVTVQQPVDGLYARTSEMGQPPKQLGILDPVAATWMTFQVPYSSRSRPLWSPDGQQIAYGLPSAHSAILDVVSGTITFTSEEITGGLIPFDITDPRGWSADGQSLALDYAQVGALSSLVRLYDIDLITHSTQMIRQWQTDEQVTDMPLPPNATSVQLTGGARIERNSVFDNWLIMQFGGSGFYSTFDIGEPVSADINVLWDFLTNEYISLDALVADLWLARSPGDWSHDGTRLLLSAVSQDLQDKYIVTFHFTPEQGIVLVERTIIENRTPQHWLDAGDLFFSLIQDYEGGAAYVLGEIVNGEYRETPFFTLNGEQFDHESFGDWYMQANDSERRRLSCLFHWSLETRLSAGVSAQVMAHNGVGLHVYSAPDRFAAQVRLLGEGELISITGESACSGGYRWWPIETNDGTTGWATEADRSEYFLQIPILPTDTPPTETSSLHHDYDDLVVSIRLSGVAVRVRPRHPPA
jgi:hypothetical protein